MSILLLGIKIFLVRIIDVSLGTIRTIITVKGKDKMAALIGFLEIFVWFVVVKEALNTKETSIIIGLFYAGGFATGTYIGSYLSNVLVNGNLAIQVITSKRDNKMVDYIRKIGYGVSVIDIEGKDFNNKKYMLFIEIDKKNLNHLKKIIKDLDSKAFIVASETKYVLNGYFEK